MLIINGICRTFENTPGYSEAVMRSILAAGCQGRSPRWVSLHLSQDPSGKTSRGWGWFAGGDVTKMQRVRFV